MQEILPEVVKNILTNVVNSDSEGICSFIEKPAVNFLQFREAPANPQDEMNASQLFSVFTADIIKEKVIFIR